LRQNGDHALQPAAFLPSSDHGDVALQQHRAAHLLGELAGSTHPVRPDRVAGKSGVGINAVEQVGNYALRILFDDGHSTGIYAWRVLRDWWDRGLIGELVADPTPDEPR